MSPPARRSRTPTPPPSRGHGDPRPVPTPAGCGRPVADGGTADGTDAGGDPGGGPRVILDTNALMMPVECDVRLFDELARLGYGDATLVVPEPVLAELDALAGVGDADRPGTGGQERVAARVGRDLAERCRSVPTDATYADDAVVELAVELAAPGETAAAGDGGGDAAAGRRDGPGGHGDGSGDAEPNATADADTDASTVAVDGAGAGAVVVTNDGPLRDRLLDRGVRVIGLRGRNKLDTTQP